MTGCSSPASRASCRASTSPTSPIMSGAKPSSRARTFRACGSGARRCSRSCSATPNARPRSSACPPGRWWSSARRSRFSARSGQVRSGFSARTRETMRALLLVASILLLHVAPAIAISNDEVRTALEQRFKGDRTGACIAAGVIDSGAIATGYYCADPASQRPYDDHTAFEIGSISKTMTAALLAELVARGDVALGDPIAKLLPPGTRVPSFNGHDITIGQIVTHTSGLPALPANYRPPDINNPYAAVTERDLLDALAGTILTREPGSAWEYSNFATMVLSYALAKRAGTDYETLLRERLLTP